MMREKTIICPFYCGDIDFTEMDKAEADGWTVDDMKYVPDDGFGKVHVRCVWKNNGGCSEWPKEGKV